MDHHPSAVVTADPPIVGPLYTTDEVAKLLRVSQRTVQGWIRSGTLTAVRYGRLLRIRQADLAAFGEVLTSIRPQRTRRRSERANRSPAPRHTAAFHRGWHTGAGLLPVTGTPPPDRASGGSALPCHHGSSSYRARSAALVSAHSLAGSG